MLYLKQCIQCKKEFETKQEKRKYCSRECSSKNKVQLVFRKDGKQCKK